MLITALSAIIIMAAYFLLLYAAVGFIQDKRLFSSAPKEIVAVIRDKKERFHGAHAIGWLMAGLAVLLFLGAFALGAWDGIRNDFGFIKFFARFLIMLYLMEIYDIFFFDWFLLCHSEFYPRFYPETREIVGPHLFGFNMKEHMIHFVIYIPVCAVTAGVCSLIRTFH